MITTHQHARYWLDKQVAPNWVTAHIEKSKQTVRLDFLINMQGNVKQTDSERSAVSLCHLLGFYFRNQTRIRKSGCKELTSLRDYLTHLSVNDTSCYKHRRAQARRLLRKLNEASN